MSTYIMSDIHGDMLSFKKMLDKVSFKENEDFLIVNGDVLDRGEHGIELIFFIMDMVKNGHAVMLKGNHELFAQMYLEGTMSRAQWIRYYGEETLKELDRLDREKKDELLGFIKQLPMYLECENPKYGKTVITHTGLMDSCIVTKPDESIDVIASIEKAASKDEYSLLISADIHYWGYERTRKLDKYIICGHVPTYQLGPEYTGKILESLSYMDIDAGSGYRDHGGRLACYCMDNGEVYYI